MAPTTQYWNSGQRLECDSMFGNQESCVCICTVLRGHTQLSEPVWPLVPTRPHSYQTQAGAS